MAIAQMNWGRMLFHLDHPRMAEFSESLDQIYGLADRHQGFIWRIRDVDAATQLQALGFDNKLSATVSVWEQGLKHTLVGLAARVRLNVRERAIKQLTRPFNRQVFSNINVFTSAIIAPTRIAFRIFIGHDRALSLHHGG